MNFVLGEDFSYRKTAHIKASLLFYFISITNIHARIMYRRKNTTYQLAQVTGKSSDNVHYQIR